MSEKGPLSAEGEALAEALGAMLAGIGFEIHLKGTPKADLMAAIGRGLRYVETNTTLEAPQDVRNAIAAAMRRTARI